jgi:long-chain fatty acid transport protein
MKRFVMRRLVTMLCTTGMLGISSQAMASAFQLWEQDVASIGNYHAGYAAEANDASTAWYNPAGITRIKNQQLVVGAVGITTNFKYRGSVTVIEPPPAIMQPFPGVTAQGGVFSLVPNLHYVAPITERIGFGFSVDAPFGLKTDYGRSTPIRYAATLTSIKIVDISPSLGVQVTDQASLGAGFDIQKATAELDAVGTLLLLAPLNTDTSSTNKATGTGYGYHLGGLYQFTPDTRVGISYHSQVVQHLSGSSKFIGPIATMTNFGPLETSRSTVSVTLPPYTALSAFSRVNPKVAVMGSIIYTQWNTFKTLIINDVAGVISPEPGIAEPKRTIQVSIPEQYRNTWNVSIGANYYPTDTVTLRGGLGYDETPVQNANRNVQLPDNDRYVVSFGGHFQATKTVGFDLGYAHVFINQAHINPPPQVTGAQTVLTNGNARGGADLYGASVTWDIC